MTTDRPRTQPRTPKTTTDIPPKEGKCPYSSRTDHGQDHGHPGSDQGGPLGALAVGLRPALACPSSDHGHTHDYAKRLHASLLRWFDTVAGRPRRRRHASREFGVTDRAGATTTLPAGDPRSERAPEANPGATEGNRGPSIAPQRAIGREGVARGGQNIPSFVRDHPGAFAQLQSRNAHEKH
jgi:hypothetical protein